MTASDAAAPLLALEGVTVHRGQEAVLQDVSLAVAPGTIHAVVGPNGAGKSTLLAAILGRLPFAGRILCHWRGSGRLALVPQAFSVDRTLPLTVRDFLALTRQRRPVCLGIGATMGRRIEAMLDRVGLPGFAGRKLAELSGGETQRVLLAHAMDPAPELLLLDEPSASLDRAATVKFEEALLALRTEHGVTVLMISHDLGQVQRLAATTTVLDRTVRFHGATRDVLGPATEALPWSAR